MATFDPIATAATSVAEHLEPAFTHPEQTAAAKQKLSKYGMRRHLASFKRFPPKQVMGLGAADPRASQA